MWAIFNVTYWKLKTPIISCCKVLGSFVNPVGFIKLLISKSSNIVGLKFITILCRSELRFIFGKFNSGDRAITPAKGKFEFSYINANIRVAPKPCANI